MGSQETLDELKRRHAEAELGGGKARIDKQHDAGKLTARERIDLLLDPGTFIELDKFKTTAAPISAWAKRPSRRRRRNRLRNDQRPARRRVLAGLHRLRRLARRALRARRSAR
jgi:acetyl-CoA carboxylase beta subunit